MGVLAGTPRTTVGRALALGGVTAGCGAGAVAMAARVAGLVGQLDAARADELVELAVLAGGVLVLAWLATSAGAAAVCLAVRDTGRVWRRGEAWVRRFAPGVVRRAMVVVVAAGLGSASVTSASAAEVPPTTTPTAASTVATATTRGSGPDLGWVVTAAAGPVDGPGTAPAAGGTDLGWVATAPVTTGPGVPDETAPAQTAVAPPSPAPSATSGLVLAPPPGSATGAATGAAPGTTATATAGTSAARAAVPSSDAVPVPHAPWWATAPRVPADETGATVVVVRGDTLWSIAARHLPAGASDDSVAAAWPAWYAANATTIGPDPGLILPGQVLVVPTGADR